MPDFFEPVDCSPPGSSVHGIIQARILEWVAISFFKEKKEREMKKCLEEVAFEASSQEWRHEFS